MGVRALRSRAAKRRGGVKAGQRRFILAVSIPVILYQAIGIFTIGWALALMFFKYSPGRLGGPILGLGGSNPFVGLEHFRNMVNGVSMEARLFRTSLKNTLIFAFAVLPLNLAITLPLATLIESVREQLKIAVRAIYFLPIVTGLPLRPSAGVDQRDHSAVGRHADRLALRPPGQLPGRVGGNVGHRRGLPVGGLWVQPGDLHRRPPVHPAGIEGGGDD
jgi:hypothetical protein